MKVNLVDEKRFTPVKLEITLESQKEVDQFHALCSHVRTPLDGKYEITAALQESISLDRGERFSEVCKVIR